MRKTFLAFALTFLLITTTVLAQQPLGLAIDKLLDMIITVPRITGFTSYETTTTTIYKVTGTATATTPVQYGDYYIYSDLGAADSWTRILIEDSEGSTIDLLTISQGDTKQSTAAGLSIKVIKVRALLDGTIVGTDIEVSKGYTTTTTTTQTCKDSDGGINYYVKGKVYTKIEYPYPEEGWYYDNCAGGGDTLHEWYCNGTQVAKSIYECPHGCENGVCINVEECTDSDGGKNYYVKGKVHTKTEYPYPEEGWYYDNCASSGDTLQEWYCKGTQVETSIYGCPYGCENGACIKGISEGPDLAIESISLDLDERGGVPAYVYTVYVKNIGNISASKSMLKTELVPAQPQRINIGLPDEFYVWNDGSLSYIPQNDLVSGDYLPSGLKERYTDYFNPHQVGVVTITAIADYYNKVDEIDESNNKLSETFYIDSKIYDLGNCTDSDGGIDYYEFGAVTVERSDSGTSKTRDYCTDEDTLKEGYCRENKYSYKYYDCPYGCVGGECLESFEVGEEYKIIKNSIQTIIFNGVDYIIDAPGCTGVNPPRDMKISYNGKTVIFNESFDEKRDLGNGDTIRVTSCPASTGFFWVVFQGISRYECVDSDGGKNYYVRGTVETSTGQRRTDSCTYCTGACVEGEPCISTCGAVIEYYCNSGIGTATATTPVKYGEYSIYANLGSTDSWARVIIKDAGGTTVDTLTISQGDSKQSTATGLTIKITTVRALEDGTIVGVDMIVGSTSEGINQIKSTTFVCPSDYTCRDGACVKKVQECTGTISLTLSPSSAIPTARVSAIVRGLENCEDSDIKIRKDSCAGEDVECGSVPSITPQGSIPQQDYPESYYCSFNAPSSPGYYTYAACIDKNEDGDFYDSGEQDSARLHVKSVELYRIDFYHGWNMFSWPVLGYGYTNYMSSNCEVKSAVWHYSNGEYVQADRPKVGEGYWIKFKVEDGEECYITLHGDKITVEDFPALAPGWNQIGAPSEKVKFSDVVGDCEVLSGPWKYNTIMGKYEKSEYLMPGEGYWVNVERGCGLGSETPPPPPTVTTTPTLIVTSTVPCSPCFGGSDIAYLDHSETYLTLKVGPRAIIYKGAEYDAGEQIIVDLRSMCVTGWKSCDVGLTYTVIDSGLAHSVKATLHNP